jgi:hypothetical protein
MTHGHLYDFLAFAPISIRKPIWSISSIARSNPAYPKLTGATLLQEEPELINNRLAFLVELNAKDQEKQSRLGSTSRSLKKTIIIMKNLMKRSHKTCMVYYNQL